MRNARRPAGVTLALPFQESGAGSSCRDVARQTRANAQDLEDLEDLEDPEDPLGSGEGPPTG